MEKQVTAVEWLAKQLDNIVELYPSEWEKINNAIVHAKEMEKNNVIDAWDDGCYQSSRFPRTSDAERYYNQTFKSE